MNTTLALATLLAAAFISSPEARHTENVKLDTPVVIACQNFGPGTLHVTWSGMSPSAAQFSMGSHTIETPIALVAADHSDVAVLGDTQGDATILRKLYLHHFTLELPAAASCSAVASRP